MIQAFRVTGNFTANKVQYINFPEPFLDNNIFISDSLYHMGVHSVICQIGVLDNTKMQIFPHANFEITVLPTGLFVTAIGTWK